MTRRNRQSGVSFLALCENGARRRRISVFPCVMMRSTIRRPYRDFPMTCQIARVRRAWRSAGALGLWLIGCTVGHDDVDGLLDDAGGQSDQLSNEACSFGATSFVGRLAVACGRFEAPLDWAAPDDESIEISLIRIAPEGTPKGEIWLFDGGPGGGGLGLVEHWTSEHFRREGWTVYIPSHRGTVGSEVRCPGMPAASEACREHLRSSWGDRLRHFNVNQAADDIAYLMDQVPHSDDDPIIAMGISYGAFWAERFAIRHPNRVDGLILDSALPTDFDPQRLVEAQRETFIDLVDECFASETCAAKSGFEDAEAFIDATIEAVDANSCGQLDRGTWAESEFSDVFGRLANSNNGRDYIPFLLALTNRCTAETTWALDLVQSAVLRLLSTRGLGGKEGNSRALGLLLLHNSVLPSEFDLEGLEETPPQHVNVGVRRSLIDARRTFRSVELSERPQTDHQTPTLLLSARFDLQTPLSLALDAPSAAPAELRTTMVVDDAQHGILFSLWHIHSCAIDTALDFAERPRADVQFRCSRLERPIDVDLVDYEHATLLNLVLFGVEDPWSLVPNP